MDQQNVPTSGITVTQWTWVVYVLQIIGALTGGLLSIVGVIINFVKRDDARRDPTANSHFGWQMRTFFWSFFWNIIGLCTAWILIGYIILFCTFVWSVYRPIRGMHELSKDHLM